MIIGVLGKGGTGKSTIASQLALRFARTNKKVLAIDADYNMDLVFNICNGTVPASLPHFGTSKAAMKFFLSLETNATFSDGVLQFDRQQFVFDTTSVDDFTQSVATPITENLSVIVCGPETEDILYGQSCGHSLSAPLKLYIPLLEVGQGCHVVIDEKAGSDGANSGIISGCDMIYIVTDPSLHGTKTAKQIASLADFFEVPYRFIANKVQNPEDNEYIAEQLGHSPVLSFTFDPLIGKYPGVPSECNDAFFETVDSLVSDSDNTQRRERSQRKFKKAAQRFA